MRILNADQLVAHGNTRGRKLVTEILEAGLRAADPYYNTKLLIRLENGRLVVGNRSFEPAGSPRSGDEIYDLQDIGRIYVFGAGKGVQRVAKAIEEVLGDLLAGGHVIDKKGNSTILDRIGVTLGSHPLPDRDCVEGCKRILEMARGLRPEDLVFTIAANGISSLLTMPAPGLTIDDVRAVTRIMQIENGAPTSELNIVRNHLDLMKGGRISKHLRPARVVHILAIPPGDYDALMHRNHWLHTLPDNATFEDAVDTLQRWRVWNQVPERVRQYLSKADPDNETLKAPDFRDMNFRVFGVMPEESGMLPTAMSAAAGLGLRPVLLAKDIEVEATHMGVALGLIAKNVEKVETTIEAPCALFTSGEFLVTVGKEQGIGGRNQEFAVSAALAIAGSRRVTIGSVDSDGTDGPGTQLHSGSHYLPCLAGAVVDGETAQEAQAMGINLRQELRRHNTTEALLKLRSGVIATGSISLNDLTVAVVLGQ